MAQIVYRGNLKTATFPLLSEFFGRSIIVKQQDQNTIRAMMPGGMEGYDLGIPQIYYCHNVVPTDAGYKSVGYTNINPPQFPVTNNFNQTVTYRDAAGNSAKFSMDASGNVYVMKTGTTSWSIPTTPPVPALVVGHRMTVAFISGVTYIYFANVGCYIYDYATNTFSTQALTALVAADIIGLSAYGGYMLAYSKDSFYWSSTVDATDFTPSLVTGAGGGQLESARGIIVSCERVYGGLIIFTADNAVSAIASGNLRFPFNFMEITGCSGVTDPEYISSNATSGTVYAYTKAGLQLVSLRQALVENPEVTDFLSGGLIEDFDETTNTLRLIPTNGATLKKKLVLIGNRYLIISYGIATLTHALIYDTGMKQWGRLKFSHTDCFEWNINGLDIPKKDIMLLGPGGSIDVLNTDIYTPLVTSSGVMIVGKFQYVRVRLMQLEKVQLENINAGDTFQLLDLPAIDGKNFGSALTGYLSQSTGKFREYMFHNTSVNHSLLFKGAFHAVSLVLTFNVHGQR